MKTYFHSVTLDEDKCRGCTNCIKRCPTEAIRVRKSKARITKERCIDCGECIRICPYHAKKAITDPFDSIFSYDYRVAIPAPSLYGQFKPEYSRNRLLNAFKAIGFDEVYEVAAAAELVTAAAKDMLNGPGSRKPMISSACPAVVRLIQVRFPNLIENLVRLESPMEVAARIVKRHIAEELHLPLEKTGVFFITPCAAKVTSVKASCENENSCVDGVISIKDIYLRLLTAVEHAEEHELLAKAGFEGIRWANAGGEGLALGTEKFLAVDGIHNVTTILEEVENDKLEDVEFIEALACTGGCLGGPLTVENLYVAKTRLKKHIDEAKRSGVTASGVTASGAATSGTAINGAATSGAATSRIQRADEDLLWKGSLQHKPVMKLDEDFDKAMRKLEELEKINTELPGLDCGACGAPSCRALAEDIVRGMANETDCIFKLREKVRDLASQMMELEAKLPPVMDKSIEGNDDVSDDNG